jgi:SAM-dependent methyltransferase
VAELPGGVTVEAWNDGLAVEHDIDDYYARSSPLVRLVEWRRLRLVRSLLAPSPGARVLEVGCGGGHVLALFPECDLVGVDVSGAMLEKARARLAGYQVELHKGELGTVSLEPASFDSVICTEVLEHVVDPDHVLSSIAHLLKPDARAVVTFPNDALISRSKRALKRSGIARVPPFDRMDWGADQYHLHTWTIPEMRVLLRRHLSIEREAKSLGWAFPIRCCFLLRPRESRPGRAEGSPAT